MAWECDQRYQSIEQIVSDDRKSIKRWSELWETNWIQRECHSNADWCWRIRKENRPSDWKIQKYWEVYWRVKAEWIESGGWYGSEDKSRNGENEYWIRSVH